MHFPFSVLLLTVVGALAHGNLAFCRVDAGFLRLVDFWGPRNLAFCRVDAGFLRLVDFWGPRN